MNICCCFEGEYIIESVIDRCDSGTSTQRWNKPCEEKYREICDVRARWHLGKEKKSQDFRDVARRANIFRRFSNFSSVHKQEELASREATTLGHSFYDVVEPLFHRRASSRFVNRFRPALPFDVFLGISTSVFRPSRCSIPVILGFPCACATDQGRHLCVWSILCERATHRRRKLKHRRRDRCIIYRCNAYTTLAHLRTFGAVASNWKNSNSQFFNQTIPSFRHHPSVIVSAASDVIPYPIFVEKLEKSLDIR